MEYYRSEMSDLNWMVLSHSFFIFYKPPAAVTELKSFQGGPSPLPSLHSPLTVGVVTRSVGGLDPSVTNKPLAACAWDGRGENGGPAAWGYVGIGGPRGTPAWKTVSLSMGL